MMAGFMSYFGGRRDAKQSSRDAIVTLRQQLQMIEKKEEYLQKKMDEEMKKAKADAVSNKAGKLRSSWVSRRHLPYSPSTPLCLFFTISYPSRLMSPTTKWRMNANAHIAMW